MAQQIGSRSQREPFQLLTKVSFNVDGKIDGQLQVAFIQARPSCLLLDQVLANNPVMFPPLVTEHQHKPQLRRPVLSENYKCRSDFSFVDCRSDHTLHRSTTVLSAPPNEAGGGEMIAGKNMLPLWGSAAQFRSNLMEVLRRRGGRKGSEEKNSD